MKLSSLLLSLLPVSLYGAVTADPSSLHINTNDWFQIIDDDFIPKSPDDNLTAGLAGGFQLCGFKVGLEYDILTDKYHYHRIDTIAAQVGKEFSLAPNLQLTPSIGFIQTGNFGGEKIQCGWHHFCNIQGVHDGYEGETIHPLATLDVRWIPYSNESFKIVPLIRLQSDGYNAIADAYIQLWKDSEDKNGDKTWLFIAPHFTHSWGKQTTITQAKVAEFYNQVSLAAGVNVDAFIFDINVGVKASYGELGLRF